MLKLSIPYTILNAISSSVVSLALGVKQQEETNPKLKDNILKTNIKNAEVFGISLEDYLKQKEEREEKSFKNLLKRISIKDLIEINTKVFQVTKAEESVDITVDDQYIVDCIQVSTNVALRLLRPLADASVIFDEEIDKIDALEKKWFPKKEETKVQTKVESKIVDPSEVPEKIKEKVRTKVVNKIEVTIETHRPPEPFFLSEDHEEHINVHSVRAVNTLTDRIYSVTRTDCLTILKEPVDTDLKQLASAINRPITVIKAIRIAYGQTPFTG